ncbi:MAG: hypothetical protein OEU53_04590 [Gammaproteobacteria bacterium]|nr:hypothetical protein [Gammaproteobacteria bacterium]
MSTLTLGVRGTTTVMPSRASVYECDTCKPVGENRTNGKLRMY